MNSQDAFGIVAMFYAVANLGSMDLELNLRETIQSLRSVRVMGLTLVWSWVVGPAFAVLLTRILPISEPYSIGLLIFSLARTAPALPLSVTIRCFGCWPLCPWYSQRGSLVSNLTC